MAQTTETTKTVLPRGFKILLGLSLALNLAVGGVIAGAFLRKGPDGPHRGGGGQINYARPYIQALPREERRAIVEAMRSAKKAGGRAARRALYQDVMMTLRAEEFDRPAAEAALLKQTKLTLNGQNAAQTQWLNRIEEMSVEERRSYADAVEEILKRGPKRKGKPSN